MPEKRGYRVRDAVDYTGRPKTALYEAIQAGDLKSYKVGGARLFLREDLDRWLDHLTATADTA